MSPATVMLVSQRVMLCLYLGYRPPRRCQDCKGLSYLCTRWCRVHFSFKRAFFSYPYGCITRHNYRLCQFFIRGSLARKHLIGQYIGQGAASASAVVLSDAVFDIEAMSQWNFNNIY
ncbi:hypothetical protein H5410_053875 [Solanum commersonii]|uniref:Uncharacterized protein n=1 Tax=Solanum commersonii TaxID=4109 RepID=A0A9J5X8G7_SOLCO|nr:hypothetical protein H5410_053875 [Solanum commersonii]